MTSYSFYTFLYHRISFCHVYFIPSTRTYLVSNPVNPNNETEYPKNRSMPIPPRGLILYINEKYGNKNEKWKNEKWKMRNEKWKMKNENRNEN